VSPQILNPGAHSRPFETFGRWCGPGRDGSEPGRSVERSRSAGSCPACRPAGVGFRTTCQLPGPRRGVMLRCCSGPRQPQPRQVATSGKGPEFFLPDHLRTRSILPGGSPMTDVVYLCDNRGSVHEVESVRENLILDLCTAGSYELSGQPGMLDPRARFLWRRMFRSLASALWPGYSHHPYSAWGRRRVQGPPAPVSDRPVPCRAATGGNDARAAPGRRARRGPPRLARLVLTLLVICGPLRRAARIRPGSALRYQ
jgi:hypothetical protein